MHCWRKQAERTTCTKLTAVRAREVGEQPCGSEAKGSKYCKETFVVVEVKEDKTQQAALMAKSSLFCELTSTGGPMPRQDCA